MTRVHPSTDCGNSPKNATAQDLAVALETGDVGVLEAMLAQDAVIATASGLRLERDAFLDWLADAPAPRVTIIDRVVTHGKAGAVNGVSELDGGERRFCHVIHFTSVKCDRVARISSYA